MEKPEVKREVKFDDRRKELHVHTSEEREFEAEGKKLGKIVLESTATYNEQGIRKIYKDSQADRTTTEQAIKRLKEETAKIPTTQEVKDLEKHNETQKRLKEIGEYRKNKADLKIAEEKLEDIKKATSSIKSEIGTRLKGF